MNVCQKMRSLLVEKDYVFTAGVSNAMEAMILEKAGFNLVRCEISGDRGYTMWIFFPLCLWLVMIVQISLAPTD